MITAPYNFVPINHKVVPAYWGEFISHDVPFEDGESGVLEVVIHTHSPLFVGDSSRRDTEGQALEQQFSSFGKQYFIPGSSIKGMLRNVLEVMTFSKMEIVNDHRFAIRDLNAKEVYRDRIGNKEIFAGWLRKRADGSYVIRDCGHPGRISHQHLDDVYGTDFSTFFLKRDKGGSFNPGDDEQKAAQFKYKKFEGNNRENTFVFEREDVMRDIFLVESPTHPRSKRGTIVFTGQSGYRASKPVTDRKTGETREKWSGHHLEFIFFESRIEIEVDESVMKDFFFAYYDHDKNRWSLDWTHWRNQLNLGKEIPVFFRKKQESRDAVETIKDLGLSYMYKLPYDHTVKDAIPHSHITEIDLAEAIFGFTREKENGSIFEALKGRVQVGHAFALNDVRLANVRKAVLSGPKASYYPNYIRQDGQGRYSTFWDKRAEIAGWKRYPVHKNGVEDSQESSNDKIQTVFVPIEEGAIFSCKLAYHNLKKVELGALLSAITFHNTSNTYHSLGMAKPLGYGKVKLEVRGLENIVEYLKGFEAFMRASDTGSKSWHESNQVHELLTMASDQENSANSSLRYMQLSAFPQAKKSGQYLSVYSKLSNISTVEPTLLASVEDVSKAKQTITSEKIVYENKLRPTSAMNQLQEETRIRFEKALLEKKQRLLRALEERKITAQQERKHRTRILRQERAKKDGPKWLEVLVRDRKKGFDSLKKVIRRFGEDFHGHKEKILLREHPEGYLPEKFYGALEKVLQELYQQATSKDQLHWAKPFEKNAIMKKVAEWVGKEEAEGIVQRILDSKEQ